MCPPPSLAAYSCRLPSIAGAAVGCHLSRKILFDFVQVFGERFWQFKVSFKAFLLIFQDGVELEYWRICLEVEGREQGEQGPRIPHGWQRNIFPCTSLFLLLT